MDVEFSANALSVPTEMVMRSEVKVAQSCPTLCDLMDCSLPGSSIHPSPGKNIGVDCYSSPPGDLLHPGVEPLSQASPALAGGLFTSSIT